MTTALETALDIARRGWHVLPCWWVLPDGSCPCGTAKCETDARSRGKHPIYDLVQHGQNAATTDEATIRDWFARYPEANLAVSLAPSGLMALDVDHPDGPEVALTKVVAAQAALGELPGTVITITGSGNYHFWFRAPGHRLQGALDTTAGQITVRGRNYIIVPPSVHRSGGIYRWLCGPDETPVADLPARWAEALRKEEVVGTAGMPDAALEPAWLSLVTVDERVQLMREYLAREAGEVMGKSRQSLAFTVACQAVRGFAVRDPNLVLAAMLEWNQKCVPPYEDGNLADRVRSAYQRATRPTWGARFEPTMADQAAADLAAGRALSTTPYVSITPTLAEVASKLPEKSEITDEYRELVREASGDVVRALQAKDEGGDVSPLFEPLGSLMRRAFPPTPWLVEKLITDEAVTALAGEPKTGKSWVACEVAVAAATGTPVFGKFRIPKARRVAYFFAEDMGLSIRNRMRAIAASRGMDPLAIEGLYVQPRGRNLDITKLPDLAVIVASCRLIGKIDLLVMDPLRDVHSAEENSSDDMALVMRHVRVLGQLIGCAVMFVHHMGKVSADSPKRRQGQKMRGSSAIHGSLDCGIYLSGLSGDGETEFTNDVYSEVKGARSGGSFSLTLKVTDNEHHEAVCCSWQTGEASKEIRPVKEAEDRVMEVVRALFGLAKPMSVENIRTKIGGKKETVAMAIDAASRATAEHGPLVKQIMTGAHKDGWVLTEAGREAFNRGLAAAEAARPPETTGRADPALAAMAAVWVAPAEAPKS